MDQSLFLNNAPPFLDLRLLGKSCTFTYTGTERTAEEGREREAIPKRRVVKSGYCTRTPHFAYSLVLVQLDSTFLHL